jgi:hypothetical protein
LDEGIPRRSRPPFREQASGPRHGRLLTASGHRDRQSSEDPAESGDEPQASETPAAGLAGLLAALVVAQGVRSRRC